MNFTNDHSSLIENQPEWHIITVCQYVLDDSVDNIILCCIYYVVDNNNYNYC